MPTGKPHVRLTDYGVVLRSDYALDVYIKILTLFEKGLSPAGIVDELHENHAILKEVGLGVEFVKKVIKLGSMLLMPHMMKLVPDNGEWTLMIDGSQKSKDGFILIVISALPHQTDEAIQSEDDRIDHLPSIIPLAATFIPSENEDDVKELLMELKPKLSSQPKSTMADFSDAFQNAFAEVFPSAIHLGCHYHLIERIAEILVYPVLRRIKKIIRSSLKEINLWAKHRIYRKKSDKIVIIARTLRKLANSNTGKFGEHLITLCNQMTELSKWAEEDQDLLQKDADYKELMEILTKKIWTQVQSILPRLEFVIKQFNHLRQLLTYQTSKLSLDTELDPEVLSAQSTIELDQLISEWKKLGEVSDKHKFNTRFIKAVETIERHYDLITPQILDGTLPRTNSPLENLYGQIKRMLRKWSGSKQLLESFDWAAQLAAIRQSLKGTDLFIEFIGHISSYEWVEEVNNLASEMSIYRFQVSMANSIANRSPQGLVALIRNLAIRDILG